jgi:hypothetical protein
MHGDKGPLTLKGTILPEVGPLQATEKSEVVLMSKRTFTVDPEHVARAIANSLAHASETAHQITGLHFDKYTILVHPRVNRSWLIEVKSRQAELPNPGRKRGRKPKSRSSRP